MPKYIRRDDLLNAINTNVAEAHGERCSQLLEAILNAPTADVVEVIRCKDCKYWKQVNAERHACYILGFEMDYDEFCSYGERREQE